MLLTCLDTGSIHGTGESRESCSRFTMHVWHYHSVQRATRGYGGPIAWRFPRCTMSALLDMDASLIPSNAYEQTFLELQQIQACADQQLSETPFQLESVMEALWDTPLMASYLLSGGNILIDATAQVWIIDFNTVPRGGARGDSLQAGATLGKRWRRKR